MLNVQQDAIHLNYIPVCYMIIKFYTFLESEEPHTYFKLNNKADKMGCEAEATHETEWGNKLMYLGLQFCYIMH